MKTKNNKNFKQFEKPEIEFIKFPCDIITTSNKSSSSSESQPNTESGIDLPIDKF